MATRNFTMNYGGMGELLASDGIAGVLLSHAEPMLSAAKAGAPDDEPTYGPSLRTDLSVWRRGRFQYARARVVADDGSASSVEAKTGNLKRAMRG